MILRSKPLVLILLVWVAVILVSGSTPIRRRWRVPSFFGRKQVIRNHNQVDGNVDTPTSQEPDPLLLSKTSSFNRLGDNQSSHMDRVDAILPSWKRQLPPLLQAKGPNTLQKLNLGHATEIYLLGTAHVSNESSADVKLLLESVEPDCIFVELCDARIALLDGSDPVDEAAAGNHNDDVNNINNNNNTEIKAVRTNKKQGFGKRLDEIRQSQGGSRLQALSTSLLTSVQEDYAEALGVELGGEFRAAHRYWKAKNQAAAMAAASTATRSPAYATTTTMTPETKYVSLVLGDRPLSLTLVRAWESLWWWPKTKMILGLLLSSFQKPNPDEIRAWLESVLREESDVLTESLKELQKHFPSLHTTIIAERDAWLSSKLVQTCRIFADQYNFETRSQEQHQHKQQKLLQLPRKKRVVAIVGAGHVPGIVQWLTGNNTATLAADLAAVGASSPEEILRNLTFTKRWGSDVTVQREMIPLWINQVTEVHRHEDDWSWAEPSFAALP